ncbi:Sua5/YciO/YrdC/YwlC family protein [Candidatus Arthromitus sp. SFB-mouse-NYU]|nr:Sua5/YciO/YrdC/YwlC family protein [Candidatus Arthromitus sp. SFB-mouse-NYU]
MGVCMETKIVDFYNDKKEYNLCIEALRNSEIIVFPTETVYGIGANALDKNAVLKIFDIKRRERDNPLIVHIADKEISRYAKNIGYGAYKLIDKFWPGPLTIILEKKEIMPYETTGGLDTVALRMPNHQIALDLIEKSGFPIAAPSANISGKPSGTSAKRCFDDLNGKVSFIIDGMQSYIGLESTVISMVNDEAVVLRPGYVTINDIKDVIPNAKLYGKINDKFIKDKPISPGLKYRHYAPKGEMIILKSDLNSIGKYIKERVNSYKIIGVLCLRENYKFYDELNKTLNYILKVVVVGSRDSYLELSRNLFESIRKFDDLECDFIVSECLCDDFSNAIMNRLLKAAGHRLITL